MDRMAKIILVCYCGAILLAVVDVPWVAYWQGQQIATRYALFFSQPGGGWSIDYGRIGLTVVAISALATISFLLRYYIEILVLVMMEVVRELIKPRPRI
jgi:hypothetical protein